MQTTAESLSNVIDTPKPVELSLVVPVFNEEDSVGPLIDRICTAMTGYAEQWELILVDDGSTDATLANARKHVSREGLLLRIVELQRNFGQTAAMQAGIDTAVGRLIATIAHQVPLVRPDDLLSALAAVEPEWRPTLPPLLTRLIQGTLDDVTGDIVPPL